jgi:hypothetical protein
MKEVKLIEEGFPFIILYENGIVYNSKTNKNLTIKADNCFEISLNGKRKSFSLKRLINKYFNRPLNLKPVPGYETKYAATIEGKVYSFVREEFIIPTKSKNGYLQLRLEKDSWYLHRVIAITFIPNPNNLPEINHKDENKENCSIDNLEWCDRKYNVNYGTRTERAKRFK